MHYFALINAEEDNWVANYGLDPNGGDYWTKYTSSLYWAIATLTGVGYGDISARTTSERIIAIIASIGGSTVFGFIIGNIATIMEAVDARGTQYRRRMADVKNYMMDRKFHGCYKDGLFDTTNISTSGNRFLTQRRNIVELV